MHKIGINIGTNLGNRLKNLEFAITEIERRLCCELRISSVYESESWGYHSDNPFYNIAAEFESDTDGKKLLDIFKTIEHDCGSLSHRNSDGSYADRLLDIDIIYIDDEKIKTDDLEIPHPRMNERPFVLIPLAELSPAWKHPVNKKSVTELLAACGSDKNKKSQISVRKVENALK